MFICGQELLFLFCVESDPIILRDHQFARGSLSGLALRVKSNPLVLKTTNLPEKAYYLNAKSTLQVASLLNEFTHMLNGVIAHVLHLLCLD